MLVNRLEHVFNLGRVADIGMEHLCADSVGFCLTLYISSLFVVTVVINHDMDT
ncbi:hypothetical protein D3C77_617620 [compost metagenome]